MGGTQPPPATGARGSRSGYPGPPRLPIAGGAAHTPTDAAQIPDIDVVIGAAGRLTPVAVRVGNAVYVQADQASPGHAGRYVGLSKLHFGSLGDLAGAKWERVRLSPDIADDPELLAWVDQQR